MKRKALLEKIIQYIQEEINFYTRISQQAREDTIDSEMKQEGKYDTRAIEAGYLAGAQKRRLDELIIEKQKLEKFHFPKVHKDQINIGSTLLLKDNNQSQFFFLNPFSGGYKVQHDNKTINILSASSPLARKLIQLEEGEEEFTLKLPQTEKIYQILSIYNEE